VRDFNRAFLAERRPQLRAAFQTRINALRNHLASAGLALGRRETRVLGDSVRGLEKEPDQIRFFTGFAVRIKGLSRYESADAGRPSAAEHPPDGGRRRQPADGR
jgi:hypothetical protein